MCGVNARRRRRIGSTVAPTAGPTGATVDRKTNAGQFLDDLDRSLIERLREDGREGNRSLAAHLNVNEVTVAARLRRLEETGLMRVIAVTDMRLFGHREFAFAMIRVAGRSVYAVAADVAKLPEAIGVTVCTGRFGVIAPVLGRDRLHLAELFGAVLAGIDGVDGVHGSMALDVRKHDSKWAQFSADPGVMPETQPSETVDEMNLEIIRILQVNARRSNRNIAGELGVSEGTVRGRIKRMLADRVFRIQAVSDIVAYGLAAHTFVAIKTLPGAMNDVAAVISAREDVAQLTCVLDEFDLLAVLIGRDRNVLIEAILGEISALPGVHRIEVFDGCGSLKHNYAWTWIV